MIILQAAFSSSMLSKFIILLFHIFVCLEFGPARAQTWIRVGYWYSGNGFPISDINSALFTHLICSFAENINLSSYRISFSPDEEKNFSNFTETVRKKNPSVTTILSIGGAYVNHSTFSSMVNDSSHRKSFIDSSIKLARHYGFQGLDLSWSYPNTASELFNVGVLFEEWRAATELEAKNSSQTQLILTARVPYSPRRTFGSFPADSVQRNLNWVHVVAAEYFLPESAKFTEAHGALYNPSSILNTDYGIRAWIEGGVSAEKLVMNLPYYGYAWTLVNPKDSFIGAAAKGPAIADDGFMNYKDIKNYIKIYGAEVMYNGTYVVNYCTIGTSWIDFDDVEAVKVKISYAKEKKLLGYYVWQVSFDDNWVLSQAAAEVENNGRNKGRLFAIILSSTAVLILLLGSLLYSFWMKKLKAKRKVDSAKRWKHRGSNQADAGDFNNNAPNLRVYSLTDIEAATEKFSIENKLGEGGYGPVYKGILPDGQEIAVKKLSKTSTQGFEEFKNEVMLTAKLQHVNLVKVLGFCIVKEEQMLIYEHMPNRSLDYYLFDPIRRHTLDWNKRVHIIEGVTQGLLYLQEYSRLTIIHRDLKASNVLLDDDMKPKISDFGIARIFSKDDLEANTSRVVGTHGYIPPEYAKRGKYSTKLDVYSFGVLLLQIISGKKISILYGQNENLSLLEFAYELWKDGKGKEFVDSTLDDAQCSCKLMRCLHIALLCVQENPNDRPSMLEIYSMLKTETTDVNLIPKKPAFSIQAVEAKGIESLSINDVTVSEILAR
ncbi:cysteine-rich receptor-like protein kinase 19 [Melia azedarach]|uniref:Cysteine-rich receptor-like protein kinase 19 n=1 Tax=Melia azedarach TaxID=155640 RepID=A0ACC1XET6_MELAZ|nr:cysteine-rich receptor-like protein kinase 19 [Melia azedarach]